MVTNSKKKTKVIKNSSKKTTHKNLKKSIPLVPRDKIKNFLNSSLDEMHKKQKEMLLTYNFGVKDNKFIILPGKRKFYMYNHKTNKAFFEGNFQIIGTMSPKSDTWRFAWANRYIPNDLKRTSLKIKEFGEANNFDILLNPKIKDKTLGLIFTAIGMRLSNGKGFFKIPADDKYPDVYIVFTKLTKVNKSINQIIKNDKKNTLKKTLKYQKIFSKN